MNVPVKPGRMPLQQIKTLSPVAWGLIVFLVTILGAVAYIVNMVLSDDSPRKKSSVTTVTLLRPPPPVQIKEKPPELDPVKDIKKEEIFDPSPKKEQSDNQDNTPAGDKLGLDADGTAGSDAFGLVGKKGGRSLLAGGDGLGRLSLLSKYAWYNKIVETEIRKKVMKRLDEEGGISKGKLQTIVRVSLDSKGEVVNYKIIGSSGNHKMDGAVKQALSYIRISEPPPEGMPRTMDVRISSQG